MGFGYICAIPEPELVAADAVKAIEAQGDACLGPGPREGESISRGKMKSLPYLKQQERNVL